jgi:hypothetical protein
MRPLSSPSPVQAEKPGELDITHHRWTKDSVIAGAVGIGGGTILLLIADHLPPGSLWNQVLKYVVPWAAALGTAACLYLQREFVAEQQLRKYFRDARGIINRDFSTDGISDFQKHELQEQLKELQRAEGAFFGMRQRHRPDAGSKARSA